MTNLQEMGRRMLDLQGRLNQAEIDLDLKRQEVEQAYLKGWEAGRVSATDSKDVNRPLKMLADRDYLKYVEKKQQAYVKNYTDNEPKAIPTVTDVLRVKV